MSKRRRFSTEFKAKVALDALSEEICVRDALPNTKSCPSIFRNRGTKRFQFRNDDFLPRSRKSRGCAEAYASTSHKEPRRLTQILVKKTIYGWKLNRLPRFSQLT